jgi:predicted dehydrogenase
MDFGIVSLGNHALTRVIPAITTSGSKITHIFSTDRSKGEKVSADLGAEYVPDLEKFVRQPFEAVYISSPNFLHFAHAKMSLEAGKSVLLEKPVTLKIEDTKTLARLSRGDNLKFGVGFHLRFHPAVQDIQKYLSSNSIGEPRVIFGKWTSNSAPYDKTIWRGQSEKAGGGTIVGIGVHVFDSFVNLFGQEVESVKASSLPKCEVMEDTIQATFEFRSGIIANSLTSRVISSDSNDLIVYGNGGSITVTDFYTTSVSSKLILNGKQLKEYDQKTDMYEAEIRDFVGDSKRIAGPDDAILSTKMHLLSQEAACSGKMLAIPNK